MAAPGSEAELEALVAAVRGEPSRRGELVAALRGDAPLHHGRGATSVARTRGWLLATLGDVGVPDDALAYVLEDLENDVHGYGVAAAARATRGIDRPTPQVAAALVDALERIRGRDDAITFEALAPRWPADRPTTVLVEVIGAIGHLGPIAAGQRARLEAIRSAHAPTWTPAARAALDAVLDALAPSCCGATPVVEVAAVPATTPSCCGGASAGADEQPADVGSLVLEDHDGRRTTFARWFGDAPAVVAFFYTRCPNPNKCSSTVRKLGEVARLLAGSDVRVAAITYDPGFDDAVRLRGYAESRDVPLGPAVAMLRPVDGIDALRRHFALRVGYVGSIVNRHAIELFLTAPGGAVAREWARAQWDVEEVVGAARAQSGDAPLTSPSPSAR